MSAYFAWVALRDGKPTGEPAALDPRMYRHQVPGGMISNLRTQLRVAGIDHRLDEILDEVARVRTDLGYPVMVSPFAQFLITQATLNVVQGERYRTIPDELRRYALGHYGRHAGPLAPEFAERAARGGRFVVEAPADLVAPALPRLRAARGSHASADELLLAAYYDDEHVRAVLDRRHDALRGLRYRTAPIHELVDYLARRPDVDKARVAIRGVDVAAGVPR
jgi:oxaloacetate decarboxylase alpha subunit